MDGGPLRYWVLAGTPARVLQGWTALTGAPALPPQWALGYQHARWGFGGEGEVRRVVAGYRERGLPLSAVHLDIDHYDGHRVFTVDRQRYPDLPGLARELRADGVRLVSIVDPAVKAEPGDAVYEGGAAADAFVRDARGREVRGVVWPGESVYPDFTDARVRKWWGALYAERLAQGFAGVWHDMNEPVSFAAFGERTLPRSARHALEGRGGDHREAHNVYGLAMARAGFEGLCELRPAERPFLFSRSGWAGMQRYGGTGRAMWRRAGRGCGLRCRWCWGWGCAGCRTAVPTSAGSPGCRPRSCICGGSNWGPICRCSVRIRRSGRGGGSRGSTGPRCSEHARTALCERERLLPYFETLGQLARLTGAPYVRPVWWSTPRDRALRDCEDAFLLGDALLVAPVLEAGVTRRRGAAAARPVVRHRDRAGVRGPGAGVGGGAAVADSGAGAGGCGAAGDGGGRRDGAGGVGAGGGAQGQRAGGAGRRGRLAAADGGALTLAAGGRPGGRGAAGRGRGGVSGAGAGAGEGAEG